MKSQRTNNDQRHLSQKLRRVAASINSHIILEDITRHSYLFTTHQVRSYFTDRKWYLTLNSRAQVAFRSLFDSLKKYPRPELLTNTALGNAVTPTIMPFVASLNPNFGLRGLPRLLSLCFQSACHSWCCPSISVSR